MLVSSGHPITPIRSCPHSRSFCIPADHVTIGPGLTARTSDFMPVDILAPRQVAVCRSLQIARRDFHPRPQRLVLQLPLQPAEVLDHFPGACVRMTTPYWLHGRPIRCHEPVYDCCFCPRHSILPRNRNHRLDAWPSRPGDWLKRIAPQHACAQDSQNRSFCAGPIKDPQSRNISAAVRMSSKLTPVRPRRTTLACVTPAFGYRRSSIADLKADEACRF